MKKYIIIIYNDFIDKELKGEFFCENEEQAIVEAKDFYAESLGTTVECIEIISIIEV